MKDREDLSKSLSELEARMRFAKGSKKNMWIKNAYEISREFKEMFTWEKSAKKVGRAGGHIQRCHIENEQNRRGQN